ncbi:MAG TPA: hypothetical protein VGB63_14535 [Pedobacter sp.]|jgi:hypothetical protein
MKTVLVFKTSVADSFTIHKIKPILDRLMHNDGDWNFDLEDCDNILRVETLTIQASVIIKNMESAGFLCSELED